jgi:hypothetical protein
VGFSAHVVQRPYLSFTTFNFDHDYDYNYNYNYDYDHDYDHDHYTTRATYLTVQIFATTKGNGQSNRRIEKIAKICSQIRLLRQQRRNDA